LTISKPFISVLLPVYNGDTYLRHSIESVLAQTGADFELIIWDDHSNDGSSRIIAEFQNDRIRSFSNSANLGLFKTLNRALRETKGDWIRLWSQDDVMKASCLKTEAEFVQTHPSVGMVYCAVDTINEHGRITFPAPADPTPEIIDPDLAAQIMFFHGSIAGNIANVLLRRKVLDDIGFFREDLKVSADFEMWVRVSALHTIGHIGQPLIQLRNHGGQFSRAKGSYAASIREEQEIYKRLQQRLPAELIAYSRKYHRWHRGPMYWHHAVRCFLEHDWKSAFHSYQTFRQLRVNPILMAIFWLFTANQRLFRLKPKFTG